MRHGAWESTIWLGVLPARCRRLCACGQQQQQQCCLQPRTDLAQHAQDLEEHKPAATADAVRDQGQADDVDQDGGGREEDVLRRGGTRSEQARVAQRVTTYSLQRRHAQLAGVDVALLCIVHPHSVAYQGQQFIGSQIDGK
jgi:hypothetical protein